MLGLDLQSQSKVISSINRHLFLILAMLAVLFVISQFLILATVGTKGSEITSIRVQKEALRIENESLRAEIDKTRVLSEIVEGLDEAFDLKQKRVETLNPVGYGGDLIIGSLP